MWGRGRPPARQGMRGRGAPPIPQQSQQEKLVHLGAKQEDEEHSVSESIDVKKQKTNKKIIELILMY